MARRSRGVRQVGLGDQYWQLQASTGARIARRRQVASGHRECRRRSQRRCRVGGPSPTCTSGVRLRRAPESGHRQEWLPVSMGEGSRSPGHKEPSPRGHSARRAATQGIRAAGAPKGGLAGEARARCAKVGCGDTANARHKEPQRRRGPRFENRHRASGFMRRHGRRGEDTPEVGDGVGVSGGGVDSGAAAGGCVVWPSAGDGARSRTPVLVNGSPPPPGGPPWPEPASQGAGSASWTHLSQTS